MKIELYIDKQLCDIGDPSRFSVYLKRQLYNPRELSTKDAQVSYNISLPATDANNAIFGFAHVEEMKGKFVRLYDAQLVVNGIRIFDGKFRMNEITSDSYKGNLGIPAKKSVKDIFGNRTMNEAGEWKIPFGKFAESVAKYNNTPDAQCIFPFVLYGLLPKVKKNNNSYTAKEIWDETVRLGIDDFPPSVNCLQAIRHIFEKEQYRILGTAFNDSRLTQLYMSYKNPPDYQPIWNYGLLGKIDMELNWSNYTNLNRPKYNRDLERAYYKNTSVQEGTKCIYTADLLSTVNTRVTIHEDPGYNIRKTQIQRYKTEYDTYDIIVPYSGLYKIEMSAVLRLVNIGENFRLRQTWEGKDLRVMSPYSWERIAGLNDRRQEIKLLRDRGEGTIDFAGIDIDRNFFKNNMNQTVSMDVEEPDNFPKYFPKPGEVAFVDPAQNKNLLCGFSFGKNYDKYNPYAEETGDDSNKYCNTIVAKNGFSWNYDEGFTPLIATASPGYIQYVLDDEDETYYYEDSSRFKIATEGMPLNRVSIDKNEDEVPFIGSGTVHAIVWLEKGERLTVVACGDQDRNSLSWHGVLSQDVNVRLKITPYKADKNWLFDKIGYSDSSFSGKVVKWDEASDFPENEIDLVKFLPSDIKIDDWMQNFCKAFNLDLAQNDEGDFELNVKPDLRTNIVSIIDIEEKAHVKVGKTNNSLDLPAAYEIGFTINKDEDGYTQDEGQKAVGRFETGSVSEDILSQTSHFSYNWYRDITFKKYGKKKYSLPVISENEVWKVKGNRDYAEMMKKYYSGLAQRFWYKGDNLKVEGFGYDDIEITLVKNETEGMVLSYENKYGSILHTYFTLLVSDSSHYTELECYLLPEEYGNLPHSLVKFNGDLYFPAEINGYDPLNRKKAKLKLVRKII